MPTANPILRLIDTDEIGEASVSQLLRDMGAEQSPNVAVAITHRHQRDMGAEQSPNVAVAITHRHQFQPFAALVCLHGPETSRYMAAIEAVTKQIQQEQQRTAS